MDKKELETVYVKDEIAKCEDVEELESRILPMIKTQQEQWSEKVNKIIAESGYTKSKFAEKCGVSRVSVDKWCKGSIPKNRETFLRIGMTAGYDMEHMNQLLQRYGRYPALYSKSLEDCICIFVLNGNYGTEAIDKYQYILNRVKENILRESASDTENISTVKFDKKLSAVHDEDELEKFIADNISMFSFSYHKFYAYVKMCIESNYQRFSTSVFDMAQGQGWSSSLRQCVSAIYQNKWYPTRNKIISLGLHLSMDHDQIDDMLRLAHMEPLCAKNIFESVIMFILDDASLNDMLAADSEQFDPDELCRYAREILEALNLPEVEFFITELPEMDDEW
ncbi:MAG: helix-turn-helix domain-containing protein [Clostridium sp.]|nr:helix-turn-helix domain-containing protein [Clostridium sp.]